jgi:hypothetical protein
MSDFEISVRQWLAREQGDDCERATFGQIEVRSGDCFLTRVEDQLAQTNRNFVNLSAYDLATWLTSNWWRLLWEPDRRELQGTEWRMAHSLAAIGGGYVWPDVTLFSDGEQMLIQSRPTGGQKWEPIRYLDGTDLSFSIAEFEGAVQAFVESVLARLSSFGIEGTCLHQLWQELRTERHSQETASIRRLEALLGFDAATAPDALLDELLTSAEQEGRTAVDEVVAGFAVSTPAVLREVKDSLNQEGIALDGSGVRELRRRREAWSLAGPPWERGTRAAAVAREFWGLDGQPVQNRELTELVGAEASLITERSSTVVPIPAASWSRPGRGTWRAILRSRWEAGKRFDLCRLIADGLVAPDGERLSPATKAKTSRQKFQRAFAQEFLCPSEALHARLGPSPPEDEDIEEAAQYFGVSPLLVRSKLANEGILPRF